MKQKTPKALRYKSADSFGRALGLTAIDMQLIRQKKKLIEKLRRTREQRGLSQAALASLVGSKQPAIARMESGQVAEVSLDFICKVALALHVHVRISPQAA